MIYLVDGYNLLFRSIYFAPDKELKKQREQLIEELSMRVHLSKFHVVVVFDSHSQFGMGEKKIIHHLPVHFTNHGQTADEYILDVIRRTKNPRLITVVTSDQKLSWQARLKGAQTIRIEDFMKDLQRINKKRLTSSEGKNVMKRQEIPGRSRMLSQEEKYEQIFEEKLLEEFKSPKLSSWQGLPKKEELSFESDFDRWLRLFETDPENGA